MMFLTLIKSFNIFYPIQFCKYRFILYRINIVS